MPNYKVGQIVELFCFWGEKEKTWNRGVIRRIAGVDDHLFKARMPAGWFVIQLDEQLHFDTPSMAIGTEGDLREVSVLDLIAEATCGEVSIRNR